MSKTQSDAATDSIVQTFTDAVVAEQRATEDILARTRDIWASVIDMRAALRRIERVIERVLEVLERGDDA